MPVLTDLLAGIDAILGIRDDIGAELHHVYLLTRTWSAGTEIGEGDFQDEIEQILPTPLIVQYLDDYKIKEGGAIQQGDVMLRMVSKESYPMRSAIDGTVSAQHIERYYQINDIYYKVVQVQEKHVTWNILLRRTSDQTRKK